MRFVAAERERLDRFLARQLPEHSRTQIARQIESLGARVEGEVVHKPGFEVRAGWSVEIDEIPETESHDLTPVELPLDIRYEDDAIIVINKQRGLAVHPARSLREPTLVHGLLFRSQPLSLVGGDFRPGIVHRLDKETSGLMVVAKTDHAHRILASQFQAKTAGRIYVAVIQGRLPQPHFKVEAPLARDPRSPLQMAIVEGGKTAVTHLRELMRREDISLIAARLETGRTHQIRVHLRWLGTPVIGDRLYGEPKDARPLHLHSCLLRLNHPVSGEAMQFDGEPPADFELGNQIDWETLRSWK